MRDEASGWITLHPGEFYLLWTELGLGEPPAVLGIPPAGRTVAARAELVELASQGLRDRDLGTVGSPAPDVAELLRAASEATLTLDLLLSGENMSFRALGAVASGGAVTVGATDEEVRLGPVRRTALVAAMFEAAPPLPAGVGSPGNVRYTDYARACQVAEEQGASGFLGVLRDAGVRPNEANTFLRAVTKREGGGVFGGSVLGRDGGWVRTPSTVNWVDTEDGRYAMRRGGDWVTVTPVDQQRLLSMLEEMVERLA